MSTCWPIDEACCSDFAGYDSSVQDRATALAGATLRSLTLYQVGGCPITVRPCVTGSCGPSALWLTGSFFPVNWSGSWTNCVCVGDCLHNGLNLASLGFGGVVGPVDEVKIDGRVLDPDEYAIADTYLLRTNGQPWPSAQDMTLADTEVGTWSVTYLPAHPVDELGEYAAGILACEYAKACSGQACRLPESVVSITRAGIQMTLAPGSFPGGFTGIGEVDSYLRRWNPHGLKTPAEVYIPRSRAAAWRV